MNNYNVKNYETKFTKNEESLFILNLDNNRVMEVPMWSFYLYMSDLDENLAYYGGKFPEWEELTYDLMELGFNFKEGFNKYIQQFDSEQMYEFTTIQDGYDYDDLEEDF